MKLVAADLRALRASLLAALAMVACGAAAVHFSLDANEKAKKKLASAQLERNEFDQKLRRVRSEEDEIKAKSALFNSLEAKGVIGEERRLEWLELIKEIRDRRQVLDLRYEFSPQRALDEKAGGFTFYASAMKLQMPLLHEEDLTRVLADLRDRAQALIKVRSCSLARLEKSATGSAAALRGECLIDWVTLREIRVK